MDLQLPLPVIGWLFTVASVLALAIGALLIVTMHRSGELYRRYLANTVWNDMALFGIWILGLVGGIGVLRLRPWGRDVLELFCWTLIALTLLSAAQRLYAYKRQPRDEHVNWVGALSGVLVVLIPVIAVCAAALVTLRGDAARAAFAG
ncbi:MAG TPA: hypothetical protein VML91_19705 [Burkholderiales bacterium]|nr:hypothetical protein [Burkholderiales bacterium]